jgi:hypothetical protein
MNCESAREKSQQLEGQGGGVVQMAGIPAEQDISKVEDDGGDGSLSCRLPVFYPKKPIWRYNRATCKLKITSWRILEPSNQP